LQIQLTRSSDITLTQEPPLCNINGIKTSSSRETKLNFNTINERNTFHAIYSSSLFFIFYQGFSNCRDLNPSDLLNFKIFISALNDERLVRLSNELQKNMLKNSWFQIRNQKQTGEVKIQSFTISLSKLIIDEIDKLLAEHFGFTQEELDFIINYDIKYRMGKELEEGE
jgi:hypothetical protein